MERGSRWHLLGPALLLAASTLAASPPEQAAGDPATRAIQARSSGDYKTAVEALTQLVTASPGRTDYELLLAETLAWDKRFAAAESHYRHVLEYEPRSRQARLGLARVLLWDGLHAGARREFDHLLRENSADVDALEGRATASYWSGDFRSAARDFHRVLTLDPHRAAAQHSLDEIARASAPEERMSLVDLDDNQPYRLFRSELSASVSSDPLTRWSASAGTYRARAPIYGTSSMPFARAGNETVLPVLRLTVATWLGLLRYADGVSRPVGGLTFSWRVSNSSAIVLRAERNELLATATGMATHPSLTTFSAGWRRESSDGWMAAAEAAALRYFDRNHGVSAYAYSLVPLLKRGSSRLYAGASATYRNSQDSRFSFAAVSSIRAGDQFGYAYRGEYAPYWAPQNFHEARAVLVAQTTARGTVLKLHADAGVAHDRAVAFGPPSGPTPLPVNIYSFDFRRGFRPYRAALTLSIPVTSALSGEIGFENASTIFYRANTFHASVVRRR